MKRVSNNTAVLVLDLLLIRLSAFIIRNKSDNQQIMRYQYKRYYFNDDVYIIIENQVLSFGRASLIMQPVLYFIVHSKSMGLIRSVKNP